MVKNNNFRTALKVNIPNIKFSDFLNPENFYKNDLILKKLGLLNLPKNIKAKISTNCKYLELKLPEENATWDEFNDYEDNNIKCKNKHLVFRIPLKEEDISIFYQNEHISELSNRYNLYSKEYKENIINYSRLERAELQKKFPGLVFNIKIRMKSKPSYERKITRLLTEQEKPDLFINDIIAERIILSEYNGKSDEKTLKQISYKVAKALYDFRIKTNFEMKKATSSNTDKKYLTKDYYEHPKESGYESLHITVHDKTNPDCCYETQIRTYDMEKNSKTSGEQAHKKYKPRLFNDNSILYLPEYSEVTNFTDSDGYPTVIPISVENAFYHFYNKSYQQYRNELCTIEEILNPIVLDNSNLNSPARFQAFKKLRTDLKNLDKTETIIEK